MPLRFTTKWDGPVDYEEDWRFVGLKTLIASSVEANFDKTSGELGSSFRVRRAAGGRGAEIRSDKPYAAIQNWGGWIPPREVFPVNAAALRFETASGIVFAKRASIPGFRLRARHYIDEAVDEWARDVIGVRWKKDKDKPNVPN